MKKTFLMLAMVIANYCAYAQSYLPLTGGTLNGSLLINNGYLALQGSGTNIIASGSSATVIGAGSGTDYINYIYGNNPFSVWTNTIKRFTIDGNGNIGIGITSPIGKLQVQMDNVTDLLTTHTSVDIGLAGTTGGWARAFRIVNTSNSNGQDGGVFGVTGNGSTPGYAYIAIPTSDVTGYDSPKILAINNSGNVGIGTTQPDAKLAVKGTIHTQEVKVDLQVPGPDYVFNNDYKRTTLTAIKDYVTKNHHLPEMPSAAQMAKDGINLGDMNVKLLKKVEELTLYAIDQQKQIEQLKQEKRKREQQDARIAALEEALLKLTVSK